MAFNPQDTTYTIVGFDSQNNPQIRWGCDGVTQTDASCPTDSAENTKAYLDQAVQAYIAGKLAQQPDPIDPSVQALVNQPITPTAQDLASS